MIFSFILVTHPSSESGITEAKNKPVQTEDSVIKSVLTLKASVEILYCFNPPLKARAGLKPLAELWDTNKKSPIK